MIRPNQKRDRCPLQPVASLLQGQLDGQLLPVPEVVVALSRGEDGARVYFVVFHGLLRQHCPDAHVRGVNLHDELAFGIRHLENGCQREAALEGREGLVRGGSPQKGSLHAGQSSQGGRNSAVILDKPPIKVGKTQKLLQFSGTGQEVTANTLAGSILMLPAETTYLRKDTVLAVKLTFLSLDKQRECSMRRRRTSLTCCVCSARDLEKIKFRQDTRKQTG